jgi:hypothetical protein
MSRAAQTTVEQTRTDPGAAQDEVEQTCLGEAQFAGEQNVQGQQHKLQQNRPVLIQGQHRLL